MTNKCEDEAPAQTVFFSSQSQTGGSSSEAGGSGASSCGSHDDRTRHTEESHDISESEDDDGMDTIKRNIKQKEPIRPPRTIDTGYSSQSLEYYNLCHPPPPPPPHSDQPMSAPAIPRRAPYISHGAANTGQDMTSWQTRSCETGCTGAGCPSYERCQSRASDATLTSIRTSLAANNKRKHFNRRRKGSVCNCKHSSGTTLQYFICICIIGHDWILMSGLLH